MKTFTCSGHQLSKKKEKITNYKLLYFSLSKYMDSVYFQTNAFSIIFPKHNSYFFFWRAGINNLFYWCSFTLLKILAVGRHAVQMLECRHTRWNKRLPVSALVKIISSTETHSWIPNNFRRGNHRLVHAREKKELNLSLCMSDELCDDCLILLFHIWYPTRPLFTFRRSKME